MSVLICSKCVHILYVQLRTHYLWYVRALSRVLNILFFPAPSDFWLGSRRMTSQDPFLWVSDNTEVVFDKWAEGQPDIRTTSCIVANHTDGLYLWHDYPCSSMFNYICELPYTS